MINVKDYFKGGFQFLFLALTDSFFLLSGLFMVAIAIPFRVPGKSVSDGRDIVNLPNWAYVYGNDYDGLLGDKRNWYAENTPFGLPVTSFVSMYNWAALRNPSNNMRMYDIWSCPITGSTITYKGTTDVSDSPGKGGWQFVKCETPEGKVKYGFYLVHEWNEKKCFVIRLGFKVEPKHAGTVNDRKGFTNKIVPWKSL